MAGHSKWHNIQHRKGAQDKRRGKLFTKLIREIMVAARKGDADPANNPGLRAAIDKALSNNMTKDTIERAVKRGSGADDGNEMQEVRYEGYGPNGIAILVECLTDNKNRTVAEVRHAFSKNGGNLGTDGSVAYLFKTVGVISFIKELAAELNPEQIMEAAIDAGAEDVNINDDSSVDVITDADSCLQIKASLAQAGFAATSAEIVKLATTEVTIDDEEQASMLIKLSDMLEDLDDVQQVFTNANIDDSILSKIFNN